MLKTLFNGSLILAFSGFVLICSASPESSSSAITRFIERVGAFTIHQGTSLLPSYYAMTDCETCYAFPYQISLIGAHDYYDILPSYGDLLK